MKNKLLSAYLISLLLFNNSSFASNKKSSNDNGEIDRMEMLQNEVQNLILKIENLEHTVSNLKQELAKQQNANALQNNQGSHNSGNVSEETSGKNLDTSPGTAIAAKTSPESILVEEEKPRVSNEKSEYQDALICLKEAGAIKIIDERKAKLEEAEEKFKNFIAKYKDSALIPNAHFWYGEIFFQRKDYNKAAVQYLKSYKTSKEKNITKNNKSPDALLKLASSLSELRKNKDACGMLDKLTQEFPKRTEEIIKKEREIRIKLGCK